jgi:NitT/TauT family transport system substrate-binding protein
MLAVLRLEVGKVPALAVAAYYQKDPQTLVVHPNDGIESLADLKGHPLMIATAQRNGYWQWLKARYGLDDGQLKPYSFTSAGFIADPHSAQQGYITNDGYVLGSAVPGARSLLLADAGYPNYGNVLMTMQQTVKSDPEMVQAVVDGSAEGWLSCVAGDFAGAKDAILAASPSTPPALFDYSMKEANERSLAGSGKDVGKMTDARWAEMYHAMNAVGVLPDGLDYKAAYTLQFVDKIGAK